MRTIRVTKIGITRLPHVLWKCFVCPQNVNLPISILLYSTKISFFVYILKTKSIRAFMNVNNSLTHGLYRRLTNGSGAWSRAIRTEHPRQIPSIINLVSFMSK